MALLAGCPQGPDPVASLEACTDAACQAEWIGAAWERDPERSWAVVLGVEAELERTVLVTQLASAIPGALEGRCQALPEGSSRARCMRQTRRPHLQAHHVEAIRQQRGAPPRSAPGPRWAYPPLPARDIPVEGHDCEGEERDECLFRAAEAMVVHRGLEGLEHGVGLCAASAFGPRCLGHLLELASPPAPPADAAARADVDAAVRAVQHIRAVAGDEETGDQWADFVWSLWLTTAYDQARELRGDLLDTLPAEAAPQLRFAAAWKLVRAEQAGPFELESTAVTLSQALEQRAPAPLESPALYPASTTSSRHSWNGERRGEGAIPAAFCMGTTRRATDPDPAVDLRLAILEARARLPRAPDAQDFLALVGTDHPEVLRWTGARLGSMLEPDAAQAMLADSAEGETPLVLGRLEAGRITPHERR